MLDRRTKLKHLIAIFLLFNCINTNAALNKWVDTDGKVHYSDTAPADVKVKTLKSPSVENTVVQTSGVPSQKTLAEREVEWQKSQKMKEESAKKVAQEQEVAAVKQKNCDGARSNLAAYENSGRMVQYDAKGEKSFLDEAARAKKLEDARKAVSNYCN